MRCAKQGGLRVTHLCVFGAAGTATTRTMVDAVLASIPEPLRIATAVVLSPTRGEDGSSAAEAMASAPADSIAVLSADHAPIATTAGTIITFGLSPSAEVLADALDVTLEGTVFSVHARGESLPVQLKLLGEHLVPDALAAIAVALAHGVTLRSAVVALEAVQSAGPGRMERLDRSDGITIINDTASSDPQSTAAALKTLAQLGVARRSVAILGVLSVVGDAGTIAAEHDRIGRLIVRLNIKKLVVVGYDARHIHNAAGLEGSWDGESVLVETADEAYDLLREVLQEQDVVLVKSSSHAGILSLPHRLGRADQ